MTTDTVGEKDGGCCVQGQLLTVEAAPGKGDALVDLAGALLFLLLVVPFALIAATGILNASFPVVPDLGYLEALAVTIVAKVLR